MRVLRTVGESIYHMLVTSPATLSICYDISKWLRWELILNHNIVCHFISVGLWNRKRDSMGLLLIWLVVVYVNGLDLSQ